jgi:hypothetical protein
MLDAEDIPQKVTIGMLFACTEPTHICSGWRRFNSAKYSSSGSALNHSNGDSKLQKLMRMNAKK